MLTLHRLMVYTLSSILTFSSAAAWNLPMKVAYAAELVGDKESVGYITVSEALENWQDGQTLRLLADAEVKSVRVTGEKYLDLNFYTLRGDGSGSVVELKGNLTVENGTIAGGSAAYGGGVSVTNGNLFLKNVIVEGNTASERGGGVSLRRGSALVMEGGCFTGNSAECGGGIYVEDSSAILLDTSEISENTAVLNGGGAYVCGYSMPSSLELRDESKISFNSALQNGGGISVWKKGRAVLKDFAEVGENHAEQGGGVFLLGETGEQDLASLTVESGQIVRNVASDEGGGVAVTYGGTLLMRGGEIAENSGVVGGVAVYEQGVARFSGTATVDRNRGHKGDNVYLRAEKRLMIEDGFSGRLGVSMEREGILAESFEGGNAQNAQIFSDLDDFEIAAEGNVLRLVRRAPVPPPEVPGEGEGAENSGKYEQLREPGAGEIAVSVMIVIASVTAVTVLAIGFITDRKRSAE